MQKVAGERYVYKFMCEPEALFSMAFPDNQRPVLKADKAEVKYNNNNNTHFKQSLLYAGAEHHHHNFQPIKLEGSNYNNSDCSQGIEDTSAGIRDERSRSMSPEEEKQFLHRTESTTPPSPSVSTDNNNYYNVHYPINYSTHHHHHSMGYPYPYNFVQQHQHQQTYHDNLRQDHHQTYSSHLGEHLSSRSISGIPEDEEKGSVIASVPYSFTDQGHKTEGMPQYLNPFSHVYGSTPCGI